MTLEPAAHQRLQFLSRVVRKECQHLMLVVLLACKIR